MAARRSRSGNRICDPSDSHIEEIDWTGESIALLQGFTVDSDTPIPPSTQLKVLKELATGRSVEEACLAYSVNTQVFTSRWGIVDFSRKHIVLICGVLVLIRKALRHQVVAYYLNTDENTVKCILHSLGLLPPTRILPVSPSSKAATSPRKVDIRVRLALAEMCELLDVSSVGSSRAVDLCEVGVTVELAAEVVGVPSSFLRSIL